MPKMKTRRSVAKRFRITAGGKVRRAHAFRRHLLSGRDSSRKRRLRRPDGISPGEEERIKRLLPYG